MQLMVGKISLCELPARGEYRKRDSFYTLQGFFTDKGRREDSNVGAYFTKENEE